MSEDQIVPDDPMEAFDKGRVVGELMVLREGFEVERRRSSSTMGRATWASARNLVDDRLRALGVDVSGLPRGRMSTGPVTGPSA